MFFELQLSSKVFGKIVRNRIKAIPLCIDQEFDLDGERYVIDYVDIIDSITISKQTVPTQIAWIFSLQNYTSSTVPYLQIKQGVTVHLVKGSDLEQNGPEASQPSKEFTVFPVFNVSMQVVAAQAGKGGPVRIRYAFDHVEYGILDALIPPAYKGRIEEILASYQLTPTTIDLSSLSGLLNRPVTAINAGITCNSEGDLITMRIEISADADLGPDFFTLDPVSMLNGGDWALLVDARIFTEEASTKIKDGLKNVSKFRLRKGPAVSWDPSGPAIDVNLGGEAVDACPFFVDNIDMDVDVKIRAVLSVPPQTKKLRTHYHFNPSASNIVEEVACAVTAALLWPFVGLVMFDRDQIDLPKYLIGIFVHPLIRFVALIFAIETQGLSDDISRDLGRNCKKQDDENYECEDDFDFNLAGLGGRLELNNIKGITQGPVLSGTVANLRDFDIGQITSVNVAAFKWQATGQCKSGFFITNQASIFIGVEPPVTLCSARIIDDPLNEFALTMSDNEVIIRPGFKPDYVQNPYPCRIRLVTTRGVRTITIPPPRAQTIQETQDLETGRLKAIASCYRWEKHFTPREKIRWLIDPPSSTRQYLQLWQIDVINLQPGDRIRVEDQAGKRILSALPSENGIAGLTLLFEGEDAPSELSLELDGIINENQEPRKMEIRQTLYAHRSSVPAPVNLQRLSFEKDGKRNLLVYSSLHEEHHLDVSAPTIPVLQGLTAESDHIIEETQVIHRGQQIASSITQNKKTLELLRPRLGNILAIGNPRIGELKKALYVGLEQGGTLFDISNPEKPRELQKYEGKQWFEETVLSGRLLARHAPEKGKIEIFEAIASRTI